MAKRGRGPRASGRLISAVHHYFVLPPGELGLRRPLTDRTGCSMRTRCACLHCTWPPWLAVAQPQILQTVNRSRRREPTSGGRAGLRLDPVDNCFHTRRTAVVSHARAERAHVL